MVRVLGNFFSKLARKYLSDAFIFAIVLTILVFILGLLIKGASFMEMTAYWGNGFWSLLGFSMQMVMILVTGSALALSKPIHKAIVAISKVANTPVKAVVVTTIVMTVGCWLNWGFGLIISAVLAKELAKRVKGIHYPLLVASAYSGFVVWHSGLSGSIPLTVAAKNALMEKFGGGAIIPTSETILLPQTVIIVLVLLVSIPIINVLMMPKKKDDIIEVDPALFAEDDAEQEVKSRKEMTPAEKMENSIVLALIISVVGIIYAVRFFVKGGTLSLDIVNFIFLILGLLLHKTPINYVKAVNQAVKTCGGIVLQFPFYAGIMGMMVNSGLAATFSHWFVSISTAKTFPFFTYLSAGLVNLFVPSGGGQWAVQGPIVIPAAQELGVPLGKAVMAIAWGDAWTNMIQPFWALPLLAVAKLNIKDIMGYTTVILLWSGIITSLGLLLL